MQQTLSTSAGQPVVIRAGIAGDQAALNALIASERLNPMTVNAENFLLAIADRAIVGAVQLRRHADGAEELASLVVDRRYRGHSLAARLISSLLARIDGPIFMITRRAYADRYARWGFTEVARGVAPASIRFHHGAGQLMGLFAILKGRLPRRLAILRRGLTEGRA